MMPYHTSLQNFEDGYFYDTIDKVNGILAFIVFIVLTIACFSTLSYINGVPMAKKCPLLYMYKDTISSVLLLRAIRMIEALLGCLNIGKTNKFKGLTLTFTILCVIFYLILILTFVNVYKLYMDKTKTVDPKNTIFG